MQQQQLVLAEEARSVSEQRYRIATERFKTGDISIGDLNISMSEKDRAQRDYVQSLRDYWESYYKIRLLTLYDFRVQQKIQYNTYKPTL